VSIFLGRQPILDRMRRTFAYELLYRNGSDDSAIFADPDDATRCAVECALLEWGLTNVVGDALAFINVTADYLRSGQYLLLPADRVVLELLESEHFSQDTATATRAAVSAGFRIALDDLVTTETPGIGDFLPMVDVIKVDVVNLDDHQLRDIVRTLRRDAPRAKLLAEKVETVEVFEYCRELGFDLFQGYFFAKAEVLERPSHRANRQAALMLLMAVQNPDVTIVELAELATGDPTLAYRLLGLVNSTATGLGRAVESVHHAIVLLGIDYVRQLATLLTIAASSETNEELVALAATRARVAELLVDDPKLGSAAFTAGLLSVIDAVFHTPMAELVDDLPLAQSVRVALLDGSGPIGEALSIVRAYEQADLVTLELLRPGCLDEIREAFGEATFSADRLRSELAGMAPARS
jgi:c-di-GMP phosphodiesterase